MTPASNTPKSPGRRCVGFGEREGNCRNIAGSPWTNYWCAECDEERRAHLSAQFERMTALFGGFPNDTVSVE